MSSRFGSIVVLCGIVTATYVVAAPHVNPPVKVKGSAISRAIEAFDKEGVAYAYKEIGDEAFIALATRLGYDKRSYLEIRGLKFGKIAGNAEMTDDQLIGLAEHIAVFPALELLEMRGNDFSERGLELLPPLPRLKVLRLSGPEITDDALNLTDRFPAVAELWLSETSVTGNGIDQLKKRAPSCEVRIFE